MSATTRLPVADTPALRRYVKQLARRHPRMLFGALGLHVLAAVAALAAPRLLGDLVEAVEQGTTTGYVDRVLMVLAGFLVAQTVLTRYARYVSQVLGEQVLADLREDFVDNALSLPVGVVESAGSGDLLPRTSRDVDQLGWSVRMALPEWTIAVVTAALTLVAALSIGWWVALPCLLAALLRALAALPLLPRRPVPQAPLRLCLLLRLPRPSSRPLRRQQRRRRLGLPGRRRKDWLRRPPVRLWHRAGSARGPLHRWPCESCATTPRRCLTKLAALCLPVKRGVRTRPLALPSSPRAVSQ